MRIDRSKNERGYAVVGLHQPKTRENVGSALRAASCYGATMVVTQGQRYCKAPTDTFKSWKHLPLVETENLLDMIPYGCVPVAVEFIQSAQPLNTYRHPERAFYIFGPEDGSVPKEVLEKCRDVVYIPTENCMNLAATVNVVLYDRLVKQMREHPTESEFQSS